MLRMLIVTSMLAYGPTTAFAQTTGAGYDALPASLAGVARTMHTTIRGNLAKAAEEMPAEEYAFRPTPEVRTFAQLIGHVVNANRFFCAQAAGEKPQAMVNYERVADKAVLVEALKRSLADCDRVYASTTDASFNQPVTIPADGGAEPAHTVRGAVLMFNIAHNNEHYGNIVVYMRLKGHIPPSTAQAVQPPK